MGLRLWIVSVVVVVVAAVVVIIVVAIAIGTAAPAGKCVGHMGIVGGALSGQSWPKAAAKVIIVGCCCCCRGGGA